MSSGWRGRYDAPTSSSVKSFDCSATYTSAPAPHDPPHSTHCASSHHSNAQTVHLSPSLYSLLPHSPLPRLPPFLSLLSLTVRSLSQRSLSSGFS